MKAKVYKNQAGTLYAVREKNGALHLCCKTPIKNDTWDVSVVLAACAGADATTAEELQAVLDRAAEVKGWEAVEASDESEKASDEPDKACLCVSCTCTGCHDKCYGHCTGCGVRTTHCNSYQTEGTKTRPAKATTDPPETTPPAAPLVKPAPKAPAAFSYDGLDENTRQALRISEKMILEARQTFVIQVAEAVNIAHDALCGPGVVENFDNSLAKGNRGENTFRSWCAYMGFSKDTAYNLLRVHKLLAGASEEEMEHLEAASPSLLYAAAKPSAPAELVQAVKEGDITTHKQYREAMERLRAVEAERNELELQTNIEMDDLRKQLEAARSEAETAGMRADTAQETAHRYYAELEQARAQNNELLDQQAAHISRIQELEARPVDVAVQQPGAEEIERWREEGRAEARDESRENIHTMEKLVEKQGAQLNRLRQQLAAAPAAPNADDCQRLMDTFADTLDGFRAMIRQTFDRAQLTPRAFEQVTSRVRGTLGSLSGYIVSLCPDTNDKEDDPFAE